MSLNCYLNLKFAYLSIKRESIKDHGADEGDVGGLAVVDPLVPVNPQASKLGENRNSLEGLEVVDEDVGNPETVDQLKVY